MREVAVIGVGIHPWGRFPEKTFVDLGAEAIMAALEDGGLEWQDIQALAAGIYVRGGLDGYNLGQSVVSRLGETGIPIVNIFNMCATASSVFRSAWQSVASGEQDVCLALGLDVMPEGFLDFVATPSPQDTNYLRWRMLGMPNPAYWAIECRKRMERYGTTERHLAMAKVACSKHGALNPRALFRKEYTVEEVLASPMVCDPLRLFEICAVRSGAAAAVLCSADKAKKYRSKPVIVAGVGMGSSLYGDPTLRLGLLSAPAQGDAPIVSESYMSARMAYKQAGIGPEDLDFVELPDNSSWHYLQYIETIGICEPGGAERLLEAGETVLGGKIPVCPSGGASSFGEAVAAQGLLQVWSLVEQLRGQAGSRQVEGARVGMAQTYGMLGNSAAVILKV